MRFGEAAPLVAPVGGLNFGRDVFVESGVGEQAGYDQMRVLIGNIVAQLRECPRAGARRAGRSRLGRCRREAHLREALLGEIGVVVVAIDAGHGAVVFHGHGGVMFLIGVEAGAPVERGGDLLASGVFGDLVVDHLRGLGVIAQAVGEPGGAPVSAGRVVGAGSGVRRLTGLGKARGEVTVVADGVGIILAQQVHVAAGVERFGEPGTGGEAGFHLIDDGLLGVAVVFVAGEFHQQIEAAGSGFVVGVGQAVELSRLRVLSFHWHSAAATSIPLRAAESSDGSAASERYSSSASREAVGGVESVGAAAAVGGRHARRWRRR